jgi:hypothetical protein
MPVLHEAPVSGEHPELPRLDCPPSVANDNAGRRRVFETIPEPMGWKEAAAYLLASGLMAAIFTVFLLFVIGG